MSSPRRAVVQAAQNRVVLPFTQFPSLVRSRSRARTYLSYVTKWKWHKQRRRRAARARARAPATTSTREQPHHPPWILLLRRHLRHPSDRPERYDPASRPARGPIFLQRLRRTANSAPPIYILVEIIFVLRPAVPISALPLAPSAIVSRATFHIIRHVLSKTQYLLRSTFRIQLNAYKNWSTAWTDVGVRLIEKLNYYVTSNATSTSHYYITFHAKGFIKCFVCVTIYFLQIYIYIKFMIRTDI